MPKVKYGRYLHKTTLRSVLPKRIMYCWEDSNSDLFIYLKVH